MKFDSPSPISDVDKNGNFDRTWVAFWTKVRNGIVGRSQAGPSAERPVRGDGLEIGLPYYDTTLGKPIWIHQVTPAVVWHDATGAIV